MYAIRSYYAPRADGDHPHRHGFGQNEEADPPRSHPEGHEDTEFPRSFHHRHEEGIRDPETSGEVEDDGHDEA